MGTSWNHDELCVLPVVEENFFAVDERATSTLT